MGRNRTKKQKPKWEFPVVSGISSWIFFNQIKGLTRVPEDAIRYAMIDLLLSKNFNFKVNFPIDDIISHDDQDPRRRPLQADLMIFKHETRQKDSLVEIKRYFRENDKICTSKKEIYEDIARLALCNKLYNCKTYFLLSGYYDLIEKQFKKKPIILKIPEWKTFYMKKQDKKTIISKDTVLEMIDTKDEIFKTAFEENSINSISTELKNRSVAGGNRKDNRIITCMWLVKPSKRIKTENENK